MTLHGNRTRTTWGLDGFFVDYDYDQLDRATRIRDPSASSGGATSGIGVLASYAYTPEGRRAQVTYGNGTARIYAYDAAGRTTGVKLDLAGATNDLVIGQVVAEGAPVLYNPAGQIVSLARSNDAYAWTAHALFERDYAVNGLNQYTSAGGTALAYDGRGNLTQSGSSAFAYTRLNELKTAPASGGGTATLGYDTAGRLSQYTAAGSTISMLYSGPNLVGEIGTAGTLLRRYVHGPGTDEPIVWYEGAGTTDRRWLAADQLGSIAAVSDGAGAMLGINRYDEYGIPQTGNVGRFQYTGQTWFGEIGLYNYKARWYSATLGRFMQVDPIGYKGGMNMYAYVGNDPVNRRDPTGLYTCDGDKDKAFCNQVAAAYRSIEKARDSYAIGSAERRLIQASLKALGGIGKDNGVSISSGSISKSQDYAQTTGRDITIDKGKIDRNYASIGSRGNVLSQVVGHEGVHLYMNGSTAKGVQTEEFVAYTTNSVIARGLGLSRADTWTEIDPRVGGIESIRRAAAESCAAYEIGGISPFSYMQCYDSQN